MRIRQMMIRVEPHWSDETWPQIRVKVDVAGRPSCQVTQVVPICDFKSYFDVIWEDLGRMIKDHVNSPKTKE